MTVLLVTSKSLPKTGQYDHWCAIESGGPALDPDREVAGLAGILEEAYDASAEVWCRLARSMAADGSAALAHTPTASVNTSDFGLMLAWSQVVGGLAMAQERTCVICDDPWLFRHLQTMVGITASCRPPSLWVGSARLWVRGVLARLRVSTRVAAACLKLRYQRRQSPRGGPALLVYGHPGSSNAGHDAYFGPLMDSIPGLRRVFHVDCPYGRAVGLSGAGSSSLHAWGNILSAMTLVFHRWRPRRELVEAPEGWLIRRAASREGGTGQAAMIRWQQICQSAWLKETAPSVVAWPWENHGWERTFVMACRAAGVATVGYNHAPIYFRERNFSSTTMIDSDQSLPDTIACCGPSSMTAAQALGIPTKRLVMAGAFRFGGQKKPAFAPGGPVLLALPAVTAIARQMIAAAERLAQTGRAVLVKDHPLAPVDFRGTTHMTRTTVAMGDQKELAAVVYASTSVGMESLIAGLPTFRFMAKGIVGQGLPAGAAGRQIDVDADTLVEVLTKSLAGAPPQAVPPEEFFSAVDLGLWRRLLA